MDIFGIITFSIAVLGAIGSITSWIYNISSKRKSLNIRFGDIGVKNDYQAESMIKVHYLFENKSQLPISITRIQIIVSGKAYDCERLPQIVEEITRKRHGEVYEHFTSKTNDVPINLSSLAASSGFLAFLIPKDTLSNSEKSLTFRICTNRGKAIQKTFSLYEDVVIH